MATKTPKTSKTATRARRVKQAPPEQRQESEHIPSGETEWDDDYTEDDFNHDFWPISGCCRTCGRQHPPRQCPANDLGAIREDVARAEEENAATIGAPTPDEDEYVPYYLENDEAPWVPDPEEDVERFIQESEAELAGHAAHEAAEAGENGSAPADTSTAMAEDAGGPERPLNAPQGKDTQDARLTGIRARLGLSDIPLTPTRTEDIPVDRLEVVTSVDAIPERQLTGLTRSMKLVAMMNPPAVTPRAYEHLDGGYYRVIAGKRRTLSAIRDGATHIRCNVYEHLTPAQEALLTLTENYVREEAWVRDLSSVVELIQGKAQLTADDLAYLLGKTRNQVNTLVRLAKLPEPLVQQILAGHTTLETAKRMTRLTPAAQDRLAEQAVGGEEVTAEQVAAALRSQYNGLVEAVALVAEPDDGAPGAPEPVDIIEGEGQEAAEAAAMAQARQAQAERAFHDHLEVLAKDVTVKPAVRALASALSRELGKR